MNELESPLQPHEAHKISCETARQSLVAEVKRKFYYLIAPEANLEMDESRSGSETL